MLEASLEESKYLRRLGTGALLFYSSRDSRGGITPLVYERLFSSCFGLVFFSAKELLQPFLHFYSAEVLPSHHGPPWVFALRASERSLRSRSCDCDTRRAGEGRKNRRKSLEV